MNDRSSSAPPLRARLRALTGEVILDAAEDVFAEQGLNAGMDAIAARAGVAVGTLYNHFHDRDGLVRALIADRAHQTLAAMDAAAEASATAPFRVRLEAVVRAAAEAVEHHAAFRRMAFQADIQAPSADRLAFGRTLVERLGVLLAQGRREGVLGEDPDDLQATLLLGLLHSTLVLSLHRGDRLPSSRVAHLVVSQFVDGARA